MAAKLGAEVTMVARLGDDNFGRDYLDNFREIGLDTSHVRITDRASTGVAPIWVEQTSGNNQIIVVLGANELLSTDDVEASREAISRSAVLVCQWECPLPTAIAAMQIAHDAGVTTIFNPAPARGPLPDAIYALVRLHLPERIRARAPDRHAGHDDRRDRARGARLAGTGRASSAA